MLSSKSIKIMLDPKHRTDYKMDHVFLLGKTEARLLHVKHLMLLSRSAPGDS